MIVQGSIAVLGLVCSALPIAATSSGAHATQTEAQVEATQPAFLGVEFEPRAGLGPIALRVVQKSAADTAGVRAGDRFLGIAGTATDSYEDIREILGRRRTGDSVQLVFRRQKEVHVAQAILGSRAPALSTPHDTRLSRVLAVLAPQPGQVFADIGFGRGWLSIALAEAVGQEGLVYAVEIHSPEVEGMQARGIPNIRAVLSKPDDVSLPEQSLDRAVLHDVASHVRDHARPAFYASVGRALKSDGHLTIFGPHGSARAMLDELAGYGFHAEDEEALKGLSNDELDERLAAGIRFYYRKFPN